MTSEGFIALAVAVGAVGFAIAAVKTGHWWLWIFAVGWALGALSYFADDATGLT